jgi:hypothetical protein
LQAGWWTDRTPGAVDSQNTRVVDSLNTSVVDSINTMVVDSLNTRVRKSHQSQNTRPARPPFRSVSQQFIVKSLKKIVVQKIAEKMVLANLRKHNIYPLRNKL